MGPEQLFGGGIGTMMGIGLQGMNDNRQIDQSWKLLDIQNKGFEKNADYAMKKQLEMWEKTNYKAQVEQMIKAGLNPALMYGMGGGGGQTTGSTPGGPGMQSAPMGGGEIMGIGNAATGIMKSQAEIDLMKAQAENLEADTANKAGGVKNKLEAEVGNIEAQTTAIIQSVENQKAQAELTKVMTRGQELDNSLKNGTMESNLAMAKNNVQMQIETIERLSRENAIGAATKDKLIEQVEANTVKTWAEIELINQQRKTGASQEKLNYESIKQRAEEITQGWKKLSIETRNALVNELNAYTNEKNATTNQLNALTAEQRLELEQWVNNVSEGTKLAVNTTKDLLRSLIDLLPSKKIHEIAK